MDQEGACEMMYSEYTNNCLIADKRKNNEERIGRAQMVKEAMAGRKPQAARMIKAIAQVITRAKNALAAKLAQNGLKPKPHHGVG